MSQPTDKAMVTVLKSKLNSLREEVKHRTKEHKEEYTQETHLRLIEARVGIHKT